MLGGRAADHFGQRRVFVAALAVFAVASLAGGLARSRNADRRSAAPGPRRRAHGRELARDHHFLVRRGPGRHRAIGLWGAMNGVGRRRRRPARRHPHGEFSWRWILLINPPIALAAALVAFRVVRTAAASPARAASTSPAPSPSPAGRWSSSTGSSPRGCKAGALPARSFRSASALAMLALFRRDEDRFASAPLVPFRALTKRLQVTNGDRDPLQRRALPHVVRHLALPPAGARPVAARRRADVPADGADDHGRARGAPVRS